MNKIDSKKEIQKITEFIKKTLREQGVKDIVIGLSGGVDSSVSFELISRALRPENIFVAHLYYEKSFFPQIEKMLKDKKIPAKNITNISIKKAVDELVKLDMANKDKIRIGNIMARTRMIILYDLAKKHKALVSGTENKSEYFLGYFTRYGDEASDLEPIRHLYKTQIYELAKALKVPKEIISQKPTAGLWKGQTDEKEFGFTYKEADEVLYLCFDRKMSMDEIKRKGFKNADKIISFAKKNYFKHKTPYLPE